MITEAKEPMDAYTAVFNCHINNALRKANKKFRKEYGHEVYNKEIKPFIKKGIMSIFQSKPNEYTLFFVQAIQEAVNQTEVK